MTTLYPFDYLPIHPAPYPLELLTSYLLRLSHLNGISSLYGLERLCFSKNAHHTRPGIGDLPRPSLARLARLTGWNEQQLQATTLYTLLNKFQRRHAGAFMRGSLAPNLRFCPKCLAEGLYYRLPWRFTQLSGCAIHQCRLLEVCGYCGQPIPLVTSPITLGMCPACGRDLRSCPSPELASEEQAASQHWQDDLVYLLTPQPWEDHPDSIAASIGPWLSFVRRERGLLRVNLAQAQGFSSDTFGLLERPSFQKQGSFQVFAAYAESLNLTWREIFDTLVERFQHIPCNADQLWADRLTTLAQAAIEALVDEPALVTFNAVGKRLGVAPVTLRKYPVIVALVNHYSGSEQSQWLKNQHSQMLLQKTGEAVLRLKKQAQPVTQAAIETEVGMCMRNLRTYPAVKSLVDQYTGKSTEGLRRDEREQDLLHQAQRAVETIMARHQPVTLTLVSQELGVAPATLCTDRYPQLKAFVHQATRQDKMARRAAREAALLPQVQAAIHQLERDGKLVTQRTVAAKVGLTQSSLQEYPAIRHLLRSIPGRSNSARYKRENRLSSTIGSQIIARNG